MEITFPPPTKFYEVFDYLRRNMVRDCANVGVVIRHIDVSEYQDKIFLYVIGNTVKIGGLTYTATVIETNSEEKFRKFFESQYNNSLALAAAFKKSSFITQVFDAATLETKDIDPYIEDTWIIKYIDLSDAVIDQLNGN